MKRYFAPALLLIASFFVTNIEASTLFGRVVEVNDGDIITVFNLNRPVRIKLLAVDAPEAGQAFAEVAKKHLAELVYDKSVLVEYWGIAGDGSLIGRVTFNNTDIGAQMIRDGAAWFDVSSQARLSVADRELYQQSEQAARSERRGLWQAENPIAPWEFVRAGALRRSPVASLNAVVPAAKARPNGTASELTSFSLMAGRTATPAPPKEADASYAWAVEGLRKNWQSFKPAGENFSAVVPEEGKQVKIPVPFGDEMIDVNVYMARDGRAFYSLMWITGPSEGETDKAALNGTVLGFLQGVAQGYQSGGGEPFSCELQGEKNISIGGYTGSEFDLPDCTIPAKVRVFTKVVGDQRQMYIGAVFYAEEDPNVLRFLKSFTVGRGAQRSKLQKARAQAQ